MRSHDDAYSGAKVEYRTSSTPADTDELDLHHSTNNPPTKPRSRVRTADNNSSTHYWWTPTDHLFGGFVEVDTKRTFSHLQE